MNIVLIGYRGTGKSEVSSILGRRLGMGCTAMDTEIVRRAGCSIPEIVEKEGWSAFRDRESELARDLSSMNNIIIDCGGGIIERPENIEALKKNGMIFWLKASVQTIVKRIGGCNQRPALTEGKSFTEEVADVLEIRRPKYKAAAHFEIDTDTLTPQGVAEVIIARWEER